MYNNGDNMSRSFGSRQNTREYQNNGGRYNQYLPYDKPQRWNKNQRGFARSIIDSIIEEKLVASGKIIKTLFDEYQRSCVETDVYTRFFVMYVIGTANHKPINDETLYSLEYNANRYIIPKRYKEKEEPSVIQEESFQSDKCDTDNDILNMEIEHEARRIALKLIDTYDIDTIKEWDGEIVDGNHDWTKPMHRRILIEAKNKMVSTAL